MCFRVLIVWCFQTLIGKFHISPPHPSQSFEKLWICGVFGLVLVLVRKGTDRHRVWCKKKVWSQQNPNSATSCTLRHGVSPRKNKPALGSWMVVAPEGALEYLDWRGGRPEASNHLENPHLKWKIWNLLITRSQTSSQGLHCSLIWSRQCWHIPSDVELWDYTIWNLYKKKTTAYGAGCNLPQEEATHSCGNSNHRCDSPIERGCALTLNIKKAGVLTQSLDVWAGHPWENPKRDSAVFVRHSKRHAKICTCTCTKGMNFKKIKFYFSVLILVLVRQSTFHAISINFSFFKP